MKIFGKSIVFLITLIMLCVSVFALPDDSVYNISDMANANITEETQVGDFTIIPATDSDSASKPLVVDGSKKTGPTTQIKYTKRLKTGANGSYTNRAIRFDTTDATVLYVDCASANSKESRIGKVVDSENNTIVSCEIAPNLAYYKFLIPEAGSYAFVSEGGGINIYYLCLSYSIPEPDPDFEDLNGTVMTEMNEIYTSPLAPSDGKGTKDEPMSMASAVINIAPGGTIHCDGRYIFNDCLTIDYLNCGTEGNEKHIDCTEGTVFDFSHEPYSGNGSARGVQLDGSYWYIKNLEVYMAADNGFYVTGKHNTLELCKANANRDTGIQISRRSSTISDFDEWPSDNLILNCTSFDNYDPATGENADGFAAKLTCGNNNVFDGCIAYNNCDDGWDCFTKAATGPIGSLVFKNCVAFRSGQTTDGKFTENCDGNGFKMGGSKIATTHYMYNCIAFENANHGFTDNSNPGPIYLFNCTSFNNALDGGSKKSNFDFARDKTLSNNTLVNCLSLTQNKIAADKFIGTVKNSVLYNNSKDAYYYFENFDHTNWNDKEGTLLPTDNIPTSSESTFVSIDSPPLGADVHTLWRDEDGSVNLGSFLKTAENSYFSQNNIGADLSGSEYEMPELPTPAPSTSPVFTSTPEPIKDFSLSAAENDRYDDKIDIRFENKTDEAVNPYIVVAIYKIINGSEVLVGFSGENYSTEKNSSLEFTTDIPVGEYDKISVFAWHDLNNITPYSNSVNILK